ncbi:MAG: hypothetical protein IPI35_32780 [Deltaproteobacteria bacterium]|nr:hypothetical protein [Deltaproteobacteria bacterium]
MSSARITGQSSRRKAGRCRDARCSTISAAPDSGSSGGSSGSTHLSTTQAAHQRSSSAGTVPFTQA